MKFSSWFSYKSPLFDAIESEKMEFIKPLIEHEKIDVNFGSISNFIYSNTISNNYLLIAFHNKLLI